MQELGWIKRHQITQRDNTFLTYPPPQIVPDFQKEPTARPPSGSKISPALLFIIVILAALFFISGILHLLVRFLSKNTNSSSLAGRRRPEPSGSGQNTLQRQLQQLFHLHDSGLDQSFIDSLPVFSYKEIVGPTADPFDCAVCLCEFVGTDQLRLLPTCSHAFHVSCIDTWLLSNSTCPLCRGALFSNPGFSIENPVFDFCDFREEDDDDVDENRFAISARKRVEIEEEVVVGKKGVFQVRLGKFRKFTENNEGGVVKIGETSTSTSSSSSKLDERRCFSMGSYQYVVGDENLKVALGQNRVKRDVFKENSSTEGKRIGIGSKTDSYSVSKIWLWSKKGKFGSSSGERFEGSSPTNVELPAWMHRTEGI
ncbi:RING/U-box superfamily protein [Striga asiatica]|uniref:RING-type E3 ubiquitin transferase n=1 Tax=Striga asiatica TaxID=4170 RepID=A0A5A7PSN7_STRAF|nr:RING/U-box superfamily protein [Striga asiatica]